MSTDLSLIEASLWRLLEEIAPILSADESAHVSLLLDAGEYGVAVEAICDLLRDAGKTLPPETANKLRTIGASMGMDASTFESLE